MIIKMIIKLLKIIFRSVMIHFSVCYFDVVIYSTRDTKVVCSNSGAEISIRFVFSLLHYTALEFSRFCQIFSNIYNFTSSTLIQLRKRFCDKTRYL